MSEPPQRQRIDSVLVFHELPSDYRISGLAFQVTTRYARNVDGDWFSRTSRGNWMAISADTVPADIIASARKRMARMLGEKI